MDRMRKGWKEELYSGMEENSGALSQGLGAAPLALSSLLLFLPLFSSLRGLGGPSLSN